MAVYAGLDPKAALEKWYRLRQTPPAQLAGLSPEERAEATSPGGMVTLANENPAAWKLVQQGTTPEGQTRKVFNPVTGLWDDQKVLSVWDHPETWIQIAAGAGLVGAVAAPVIAGAAGGSGAGAAGGGAAAADAGVVAGAGTGVGTGVAGTGVAAAGTGAAWDAAGNFIGSSSYDIPADAVTGARSYADLLRYGLPVAGSLVGGIIQANAAGKASDAQTQYLEDALAYEKANDLYNRGVAADAVKLEAQRYGDYQGRIAPFIANGVSSNDRMAALLGLPARPAAPAGSDGTYSSYGTATPTGVAVSPALTARILAGYHDLGLTPTGPGTGPTDAAYYTGKYAETGGDTAANNAYWFGPGGRIATDAAKAGIAVRPTAPTAADAAPGPVIGGVWDPATGTYRPAAAAAPVAPRVDPFADVNAYLAKR